MRDCLKIGGFFQMLRCKGGMERALKKENLQLFSLSCIKVCDVSNRYTKFYNTFN